MSRKMRITLSEKKKKIKERKKRLEIEKQNEENRKSQVLIHIPNELMEYTTYFKDDLAVKTAVKKYRNEIKKRRGGSVNVNIDLPLNDGIVIEGKLHADYRLVDFEKIPPFIDKEDYTIGDLENRLKDEIPSKIKYELSNKNVEEILNDRELPEKIIETVTYTFDQLGYIVENAYISELRPSNTKMIINKNSFEKMLQRNNKKIEAYLRGLIKEETKLVKEAYNKTISTIKNSEENIRKDIQETAQTIDGLSEVTIATQDIILDVYNNSVEVKENINEITENSNEIEKELTNLIQAINKYKNNIEDSSSTNSIDLEELRENAKLQYASELAKEYVILNRIQDENIEMAITDVFKICLDRAEKDGFSKDSLMDYIEEEELANIVATKTYRNR